MNVNAGIKILLLGCVLSCAAVQLRADDWPQYRHNAGREPCTKEVLSDELSPLWVRKLSKPIRAWRDRDNQMLDYDVNYEPIVMGKRLFVGSMNDDSVRAYDTESGRELWRFHTEGPVRFAPAGCNDKVYVTSDDGYLYCLRADSGALIWKFRGGPTQHRLIGNQRMISMWPARSGAAIHEGTVYFAAGFWPFMGCFIHAVDAESGKVIWTNSGLAMQFGRQPHKSSAFGSAAPQGYLAVDETTVTVPCGRGWPVYLNREDGSVGSPGKSSKWKKHGPIQCGDKTYSIKGDTVLAMKGSESVWRHAIKGSGKSLLAADGKLFVSTLSGVIHCFGPKSGDLNTHDEECTPLQSKDDSWQKFAAVLLGEVQDAEGYALLLGVGSSRLAVELLTQSNMKLIVVDPSSEKVAAFRRRMSAHGLYGSRVSAFVGSPTTLKLPPYFASLVASEYMDLNLSNDQAAKLYEHVRPYNGIIALNAESLKTLPGPIAESRGVSFVRREKLDGAADWTHQYADAGNSVWSADKRVRLPLGLLWFGGTTNDEVLPRHGHGPNPQVAEGRLYIEGANMLRCIDIYTGRKVWQAELPGFGKQANTTSHFPGAGEVGSNYASQSDYVYAIYQDGCLLLDAKTGERKELFKLPGNPYWGTVRVQGKYLVACVCPKRVPFGGDAPVEENVQYSSGSTSLVVMDRLSGEVLWGREAEQNFRHNAVAVSEDTVFVLDNYSDAKTLVLKRRGQSLQPAALLALDLATGEEIWKTDKDLVGTFLSYSKELDYLVLAGSNSRDRARDDSFKGIAVFKGKDGSVVWKDADREQTGPLMLCGDTFITNGHSGGFAFSLTTGEALGWRWARSYGCNTAIASRNLLFFRSGCAGYFDLENLSGTGTFGSFKSGCSSNMIAAGGVLTIPEYTRTCVCAYQNRTSLALAYMPDVVTEYWTYGAFPRKDKSGINFGAPGDRYDQGILWLGSHGGRSTALRAATGEQLASDKKLKVMRGEGGFVVKGLDDQGVLLRSSVESTPYEWPPLPEKPALTIDGGQEYCHHSLYFNESASHSWVASSGIVGLKSMTFGTLTEKANGNVKLYFAEPETEAKVGDRVFDVFINDKKVLADFDIVKESGRTRSLVIKTFTAELKNPLQIRFVPKKGEPVISGIELDTGMSVAIFNGNS